MPLKQCNMFTTMIICLIGSMICFWGCGSDESPSGAGETYDFTITYPQSSATVNLSDYTPQTIEGEKAILMSDLVNADVITEPYNFAYRLIGSDGFYANIKGSPDNTWDHLQGGNIILSTMNASFDPSLNLISRYAIKDVDELQILRKIDVITPSDSLIQHVVQAMTTTVFQDSLTAIPLIDFLPTEILPSPSSLSYTLVAADDYALVLSFEQFEKGYYVIESDRILYSDPDILGSMKIKKLNHIGAQPVTD